LSSFCKNWKIQVYKNLEEIRRIIYPLAVHVVTKAYPVDFLVLNAKQERGCVKKFPVSNIERFFSPWPLVERADQSRAVNKGLPSKK
jgi:hypothetical protein